MTPKTLQAFLHRHIPATAALGLEVVASDEEKTVLSAPHAPNRNHKNTVFGGSIALVATACGWAAVHTHFPRSRRQYRDTTGRNPLPTSGAQRSERRYPQRRRRRLAGNARHVRPPRQRKNRLENGSVFGGRAGGGLYRNVCGIEKLNAESFRRPPFLSRRMCSAVAPDCRDLPRKERKAV